MGEAPAASALLADDAGLPSLLRTGEALAGLLAWLQAARAGSADSDASIATAAEGAVAACAEALVQSIGSHGELQFAARCAPLDRLGPAPLHLPWMSALLAAGRLYGEPRWQTAAGNAIVTLRRKCDFRRWQAPLHLFAPAIAALIELGEENLAAEALRLPQALQRANGSVPATPEVAWVSLPGLAQLAQAWYAQGDAAARERADRALAWLRRQQTPNGSLPGSQGPDACYHVGQPFNPAVAQFLLASHAQVRSAFATGEDEFPAEIDPTDGRWLAVLRWARQLPPGAHLADVGCGRGRYLRRLRAALPHLKLTGIDLSQKHLHGLPPGVGGRVGHLLNLPAAAGEFDAVLCVEAVEHALFPKTACEELCRVLRPGGSLLLIDKDRRRQSLSECAPWERWLDREETAAWLRNGCNGVTAAGIDHGPHNQFTGLFLTWEATRAGEACHHTLRRAA